MTPYGILISNETQDKEFVGKICEAHGVPLLYASSIKEIRKLIAKEVVVFWNLDAVDPPQIALAQTLLELIEPQRIFGIGSHSVIKYPNLLKMRAIGHYFRRGIPNGVEFGARILGAVLSTDPLSTKYLFPSNASVKKITIRRAKDRSLAAEAVSNIMNQKSLPPRLAQAAGQCVDELLMNAIFDAPFRNGEHYRVKQDRKFDFELNDNEVVELEMTSTDKVIFISVTDLFGSLSRDSLLTCLTKDFENSVYRPSEGVGAGLGIYGIVESGVSVSFAVKTAKITQATLFIPVVEGFKEFRSSYQIFSFVSG